MRRLAAAVLAVTLAGCAITMQHRLTDSPEPHCDTTRVWAYLDALGVVVDAVVFAAIVRGDDENKRDELVFTGVDGAATLASAVLGRRWANQCRAAKQRRSSS